jgi:hypothetical protein
MPVARAKKDDHSEMSPSSDETPTKESLGTISENGKIKRKWVTFSQLIVTQSASLHNGRLF